MSAIFYQNRHVKRTRFGNEFFQVGAFKGEEWVCIISHYQVPGRVDHYRFAYKTGTEDSGISFGTEIGMALPEALSALVKDLDKLAVMAMLKDMAARSDVRHLIAMLKCIAPKSRIIRWLVNFERKQQANIK